ncbi:GNAT family N-acetyltransferase [Chloroflexi bacterium TSY]|nr:GNAT family N-acetyltransferase [Chloroflexi bacterium TSY]
MSQLLTFPSQELPPYIKYQILSYVRIEWHWIFQGGNQLWDFTLKDTHPINFVLIENDVLISHAEANWRHLEHRDQIYKVYGLSAVFTYPAFRKQGYGHQVVEAATEYIESSDADIGMLFCLPNLKDFYGKSGWTSLENIEIRYGAEDDPEINGDELVMVRNVSERGREALTAFEQEPLYIGAYTW